LRRKILNRAKFRRSIKSDKKISILLNFKVFYETLGLEKSQWEKQCCRAGAKNKLPPGAGPEIANSGSGSFVFITALKKFCSKKPGR
jgi:hypothetical protein